MHSWRWCCVCVRECGGYGVVLALGGERCAQSWQNRGASLFAASGVGGGRLGCLLLASCCACDGPAAWYRPIPPPASQPQVVDEEATAKAQEEADAKAKEEGKEEGAEKVAPGQRRRGRAAAHVQLGLLPPPFNDTERLAVAERQGSCLPACLLSEAPGMPPPQHASHTCLLLAPGPWSCSDEDRVPGGS